MPSSGDQNYSASEFISHEKITVRNTTLFFILTNTAGEYTLPSRPLISRLGVIEPCTVQFIGWNCEILWDLS